MRARIMMAACLMLISTAGCSHRAPTERELFNVDAALPTALPVQPLGLRVITSSIDREHHTMATLFGNDVAVQSARSAADTVTYPVSYGAGSTLALVTWSQKDDGHWFGARIPERFASMEVVTVAAGADGKSAAAYQRFGATGQRVSGSDQDAARRDAILAERASAMP